MQGALGRGELAEQKSLGSCSEPLAESGNLCPLYPAELVAALTSEAAPMGNYSPFLLFPDRVSHQVYLGQPVADLDIQISGFPLICPSMTWVKTI